MGFKLGSNTLSNTLSGAGIGFVTGGLPGLAIGAGAGALMGYSQDANNAAAQAAADKANAYNLSMWNRQNEYNSPVAQMARLKQAGLNPMLVYGGGNVTGNSASSIAQAETYANKTNTMASVEGLQALANLKQTGAQTENTQVNTGATKANTLATYQDIKNMQTANALQQAQLEEQQQNVQMNQLDLDYARRVQDIRMGELDIQEAEQRRTKGWNSSGAGDVEYGVKKGLGFVKELFGLNNSLAGAQAGYATARLNNARASAMMSYSPRYRNR